MLQATTRAQSIGNDALVTLTIEPMGKKFTFSFPADKAKGTSFGEFSKLHAGQSHDDG